MADLRAILDSFVSCDLIPPHFLRKQMSNTPITHVASLVQGIFVPAAVQLPDCVLEACLLCRYSITRTLSPGP